MISIIIPVFNGQEWLAEAIESALNQRVKNYYEIIVVDDGSQDGSLKIANGYPVTVISQVNKGLASARNTGIMNTKSEYCLFLDADDLLLPDCIKRIEEVIHQNSGISHEGTEFGQPDIIAPSFKCFGLNQQEIILMPEPKLEDFKTANRLGYCAAIRRSALLEVGGYNPKMVEGYEDLHLYINLLNRGKKVVTISEVLWQYRIKDHGMYQSITPEIHKKLIEQINKDFPNQRLEF